MSSAYLSNRSTGVLEYWNDGFEGIVDNSMVFFLFEDQYSIIPWDRRKGE